MLIAPLFGKRGNEPSRHFREDRFAAGDTTPNSAKSSTHRFLVGALRVVGSEQLCLALVRDFAAAPVHAVLIVRPRLNELVSGIVKRSCPRISRAK